MVKFIMPSIFILLISYFLVACSPAPGLTPVVMSKLSDGKRTYQAGYYKTAMRKLLPLACDGNAQAQYAVGYMYYYGYGVTQDTEVGYVWIERSARQAYPPAQEALKMIKINGD